MSKRVPYIPGARIAVLHASDRGTCLTVTQVADCRPAATNLRWNVTYRLDGQQHTTEVNEHGRDRHGYVIPAR